MYGIIDFPLYLIGAVTIVLIPGPNSLYCLAVATQQGDDLSGLNREIDAVENLGATQPSADCFRPEYRAH